MQFTIIVFRKFFFTYYVDNKSSNENSIQSNSMDNVESAKGKFSILGKYIPGNES